MSVDKNKAMVKRILIEFLNKGDTASADEFFADDFINHSPGRGTTPDREGLKQFISNLHAAFPDIKTTIEDLIAEGNKITVRVTVRGTHTGDFLSISPTGKKVKVAGISIFRFNNGKVVERWNLTDELLLLQQIGVIPSAE